VVYVNTKQGLTIDTGHEKTTVFSYGPLFEGYTRLRITHDMFIKGYFKLLDLTPDHRASEG
jgi:hypothetical protein